MKVLIVSKTHMNTGVCVGGITFDGRFVRLLDNNGHNQSDFLKYNHHCISVHYITLGTNMIIIYSKHNLIGYFVCPINAKQNFNLI